MKSMAILSEFVGKNFGLSVCKKIKNKSLMLRLAGMSEAHAKQILGLTA
jgi:hypothetical protein